MKFIELANVVKRGNENARIIVKSKTIYRGQTSFALNVGNFVVVPVKNDRMIKELANYEILNVVQGQNDMIEVVL